MVDDLSDMEDTSFIEHQNEEKHLILKTPTTNHNTRYMLCVATVGAFGGFLFGYDTGVISGAMIPIKKKFNLSVELQEVVVSITIGGAILGSMTSAFLNENFGRRITLIIASFVFTIGAIMMAFTNGVIFLILGRLTVGIAIGYVSMTAPVYIAEMVPPDRRGQLITLYQFFITLGIFLASLMNGALSYIKTNNWRYMLGISVVPSLLMFAGIWFSPETPRWLIHKGRIKEAIVVIRKLKGDEFVETEVNRIQSAVDASKNNERNASLVTVLTTYSTLKALIVGCGLQMFQQLSAINTVLYYSGTIIEMTGFNTESSIIWLASVVAGFNFMFTLISLFIIEKVGRRKLILGSILGVLLALCMLAVAFYLLEFNSPEVTLNAPDTFKQSCSKYTQCFSCVQDTTCGFCYSLNNNIVSNGSCLLTSSQDKPQSYYCNTTIYHSADVKWTGKVCPTTFAWLPVVAMIFYLAMFAPGLGPMPWTINAEIYPLWARSIGTSMSTATNWIFNLLISLTFLSLIKYTSIYATFICYAVMTFAGFIFIYVLLPETKGKNLEDIEILFQKKKSSQ